MTGTVMNEAEFRERMVTHGRSLFERGLTGGSSGNLSVRLPDGILITPTNSCLGRLDPQAISKVTWSGKVLEGEKPSKELFLHMAMYRQRPQEQAVVHLHSTWSVAVSCLEDVDARDAIPPITAYYVMRVGSLPLIPYFPPGDEKLAEQVSGCAAHSRAMLLANHGPVIAGRDLDTAVYAAEELEETAKLFMILKNQPARFLTVEQRDELRHRFPV